MKQGSRGMKDQLEVTIQQVLSIFQELNKVQTASKAQMFDLVKLFRQNPRHFQSAWEVAYLKIFKIFHEKANRKMPPKFQQLAMSFFQEIMPSNDRDALAFYDYFINFLSEAVFSSLIGIRLTCARMLFHLLKNRSCVGVKSQQNVLKSVYFLIRLKMSTYKQIGIKLASIVLSWDSTIRDKVEEELFKIMSVEDNEQIRKMTMTNILINQNNFDKVLVRLRDKCVDIRSIILKKLIGEKYQLENTTAPQRFKLLYDGYGNKESSVQQDTIKYFIRFFEQPNPSEAYLHFVQLFDPDTLLAHPHIYTLLDLLIVDMVEEAPINQLSQFVRRFSNNLRSIGKGAPITGSLRELIWFKNIGRSDKPELRSLFEESVPSGTEFSRLLLQLLEQKDVFSIYECLQIFSLLKSSDEIGRNRMFDSLKKMVAKLDYWVINRQYNMKEKDDICPNLSDAELKQRKMLLSYFDLPPISCSFDLLFQVGKAMKALWPDHYQIELKQLMSDWTNSEEGNIYKQRQLAQTNVTKAQGHVDSQLMEALKRKLAMLEEQIERQSAKSILIIQTILRLRPTARMDDYMLIIREELGKKDQTHGLLLLGVYCLEQQQRAESFLPLYWTHFTNSQPSKLQLLISLKVVTDFFVKFDFTSYKVADGAEEETEFEYGVFLKKLESLVISADPDIRTLALEGLSRLMFHNRVPQQWFASCFVRLLLLWWQTSSEEVSAKSVHTISIFIKQFIEKGAGEVRKLAQCLCVFFKMLIIAQNSRRMINKAKIVYNLRIEDFVKRAVVISMTVLKYQKQSRQIIWKYQEAGAELGPQEMFLVFLFSHKELHFCIEKCLNICDFYEDAPLETLILVKKHIQEFLEQGSFANVKKTQTAIKKFQAELQDRIQIKNKQTFNEELLNGLKLELHEYALLIETEGVNLEKELREQCILIDNENTADVDEESEGEEQQSQEEEEAEVEDIQDIIPEQGIFISNKKGGKETITRITQKKVEYQEEQVNTESRKDGKRKVKQEAQGRRRLPSSGEDNEEKEEAAKTHRVVSGRTRSRLQI